MKKFLSLILALAMVACMSVTAFAANDPAGTTIVNLEVPDNTPSYFFSCPASVSITYGVDGYQDLGEISVTNLKNITGSLSVELRYTNLINTENDSDSITMFLGFKDNRPIYTNEYSYCGSGSLGPVLEGEGSSAKIGAFVSPSEWEKATPGATYKATVTYILY